MASLTENFDDLTAGQGYSSVSYSGSGLTMEIDPLTGNAIVPINGGGGDIWVRSSAFAPEQLGPLWYLDVDRSTKYASNHTTVVNSPGDSVYFYQNLGTMGTDLIITSHHGVLQDAGGGHLAMSSEEGSGVGPYFYNPNTGNGLTSQGVGEHWVLFKRFGSGQYGPIVISGNGDYDNVSGSQLWLGSFNNNFLVVNPSPISTTTDVWLLRVQSAGGGANQYKVWVNKLSDSLTLAATLTRDGTANANINSPQFGSGFAGGQPYNHLMGIIFNNPLSTGDAAMLYAWIQANKPHSY